MKKEREEICDVVIPICFSVIIVLYLSFDLGIKHGLKAGIITALVFGALSVIFCFFSFFVIPKRTNKK